MALCHLEPANLTDMASYKQLINIRGVTEMGYWDREAALLWDRETDRARVIPRLVFAGDPIYRRCGEFLYEVLGEATAFPSWVQPSGRSHVCLRSYPQRQYSAEPRVPTVPRLCDQDSPLTETLWVQIGSYVVRGHEKVPACGQFEVPAYGHLEVPGGGQLKVPTPR